MPRTAAQTMLAPHPSAALEYWFFKVNAGPTALLVDWIARRRANEHRLHARGSRPPRRRGPNGRRRECRRCADSCC